VKEGSDGNKEEMVIMVTSPTGRAIVMGLHFIGTSATAARICCCMLDLVVNKTIRMQDRVVVASLQYSTL
jgi:hypothetical protein